MHTDPTCEPPRWEGSAGTPAVTGGAHTALRGLQFGTWGAHTQSSGGWAQRPHPGPPGGSEAGTVGPLSPAPHHSTQGTIKTTLSFGVPPSGHWAGGCLPQARSLRLKQGADGAMGAHTGTVDEAGLWKEGQGGWVPAGEGRGQAGTGASTQERHQGLRAGEAAQSSPWCSAGRRAEVWGAQGQMPLRGLGLGSRETWVDSAGAASEDRKERLPVPQLG